MDMDMDMDMDIEICANMRAYMRIEMMMRTCSNMCVGMGTSDPRGCADRHVCARPIGGVC